MDEMQKLKLLKEEIKRLDSSKFKLWHLSCKDQGMLYMEFTNIYLQIRERFKNLDKWNDHDEEIARIVIDVDYLNAFDKVCRTKKIKSGLLFN